MTPNRKAFDAAIANWNAGDLEHYLDLYDERIQLYGYSPEPMGKTEVRGFYGALFDNLDEIHIDVLRVVEQDDILSANATMSGLHTGELFGKTNTGIRIQQPVMTMLRFEDGLVMERWSVADTLGVMAQLGVL